MKAITKGRMPAIYIRQGGGQQWPSAAERAWYKGLDQVHNFGPSAEVWTEYKSLVLVQRFGLSAQVWTWCKSLDRVHEFGLSTKLRTECKDLVVLTLRGELQRRLD